ncbi:hypothetical protein ABT282_07460 [Streptomyces sp. NPDC000927]|uniref:hypothetical protein n=1 Tax=Streptomyces sp. NPDC000927 TaxID=3154371 RepID=UPI003325700F
MTFKADSVVYPEMSPMVVPATGIELRDAVGIPGVLREHAGSVLPSDVTGEWRTIGEFRESDGEFVMAVACRTSGGDLVYGVEGDSGVEYGAGIERESDGVRGEAKRILKRSVLWGAVATVVVMAAWAVVLLCGGNANAGSGWSPAPGIVEVHREMICP